MSCNVIAYKRTFVSFVLSETSNTVGQKMHIEGSSSVKNYVMDRLIECCDKGKRTISQQ